MQWPSSCISLKKTLETLARPKYTRLQFVVTSTYSTVSPLLWQALLRTTKPGERSKGESKPSTCASHSLERDCEQNICIYQSEVKLEVPRDVTKRAGPSAHSAGCPGHGSTGSIRRVLEHLGCPGRAIRRYSQPAPVLAPLLFPANRRRTELETRPEFGPARKLE